MKSSAMKFRITPPLYKCIVVLCVAAVTLMLAACSGIAEEGAEKKVRISLPPIESGARSISDDRIPDLKGDVRRYRVTVNGTTREGTGSSYEFTLPVGVRASVTVECLNSNGDVIIRAEKAFVVSSGENNFSINLKNDGTEIIPSAPQPVPNQVTYSYGEANKDGNKNGIPSDPTTYSEGDIFEVKDGSGMTWDHASQQSGFTGWKTNVALVGDTDSSTADVQANGNVQVGGKYKMPRGGVTLTAQWNKKSYSITYDMNASGSGGTPTQSVPGTSSVEALASANISSDTPPQVSTPTATYTFTGWNTQAGGGGTPYRAGQQITMMTEDITLYAQWTSANVYTVTYNIGSGPTAADSGWVANDTYTEGISSAITLPTLTATGYTFNGWRIDGESNNRGGGTSYTPTASVTATAQWTAIPYTITYNANGGGSNPGNTTFTIADSSVTFASSATLQKQGYSFVAWETTGGQDVSSMTNPADLINLMGSGTTLALQAKWNATQYTINFAAGTGGSGTENTTIPNFTVESTSLSLPSSTSLNPPTAKLFDNGWSLTDGGATKITSAQDVINAIKAGSGITISGNTITLYAVWKDAAASVTDSSDGIEQFYDSFTAAWSACQTLAQQGGSTVTVKLYTNASNVAIEITEMGSITLDLNGRTLSGTGTAPVITMNHPDATLTITGDGTITGGKIGIKQVDGNVTMENGTISGNTADNGAGVYCDASGYPFTMQGGTITGNTATGNGGGVYCGSGSFSMSGGEIIGNTASGNGGGVYVSNADNTFYISDGPVKITGNKKGSTTDNNVYLTRDGAGDLRPIELGSNPPLNADSRIGITLEGDTGEFIYSWSACGLTLDDAKNIFISDVASYTVAVSVDDDLVLQQ